MSINIVIDAAGRNAKHVGLMSFGKKTLVMNQISTIQKVFSNSKILVVGGEDYSSVISHIDSIEKYTNAGCENIKIIPNDDFNDTNSAYNLSIADEFIDNEFPVICISEEVVFDTNFLEKYKENIKLLSKGTDGLVFVNCASLNNPTCVGVSSEGMSFSYFESNKYCNSFMLNRDIFKMYAQISFNKKNEKKLSFEVLEMMASKYDVNIKQIKCSDSNVVVVKKKIEVKNYLKAK